MEAEAKYTYVGAAVLALVAALVVSVIWLKRTGAERDFARFTIYFEQQALDGLTVGADVNMRGISIGRVLDYQLSPDRVNRARVDVRLDRRAPVRTNTTAVITRNFVTGIAQIRLVTPEPPGQPLDEVRDGERFPVIAEGTSDVAEITGRVTELGDMAADAIQRINHLLSLETRNNASATVANLRELTDRLKAQLAGMDAAIAEISGASREFRRATTRIATVTERVGEGAATALDDSRALIADLRGAATETQRAAAQVGTAVATLEGDISRTTRRLDAGIAQADDQLLAAVGELRTSLETMQRSLDRLGDPRAALLGPEQSRLGPGEKLK